VTEPLLRPRSITELVDTAFRLYRTHWGMLIGASLVIASPQLLFVAFTPDTAWSGYARTILAVLFGSLVGGVCALLVGDSLQERTTDLPDLLRRLRPFVTPLIGATVGAMLLLFIAVMLFVIPGLFVFTWTVTIPAIVVHEVGRSGTDPISRGRELARGSVLRILGTMLLTTVIVYVLLIASSYVVWYLVGTLGSAPHAALILTQALGFVLSPITGLTSSLLYFDLRIRSEGLDLEQRLTALMPAPTELPSPPPA